MCMAEGATIAVNSNLCSSCSGNAYVAACCGNEEAAAPTRFSLPVQLTYGHL